MSRSKAKLARKCRGKTKFPGITADAVTLRVSRNFLFKVLSGDATSAPLLAHYRALQANKSTRP